MKVTRIKIQMALNLSLEFKFLNRILIFKQTLPIFWHVAQDFEETQ
jgi:hypothetical protein